MATIMLANGENPKIVSERLGHASVAITLDTCSHVLPGIQEEATGRLGKTLSAKMGTELAGTARNAGKLNLSTGRSAARIYRTKTNEPEPNEPTKTEQKTLRIKGSHVRIMPGVPL